MLLNELQIQNYLIEICEKSNVDFSGIGIVFYKNIKILPHISLHKNQLPIDLDQVNICQAFLEISKSTSAYHDGFHFVNAHSMKITHISQYISPPLDLSKSYNISNVIPCGAREMAAFLTSLIDGILCVGLINSAKTIKIFRNGSDIYKKVSA